jgi:hypothetical protein
MIERLFRRKRAYQRLFPFEGGRFTGDAGVVLADLARFCRVNDPPIVRNPVTGAVDPIASAVLAGRQEAFNRIRAQVLMDQSTLFNLKDDDQ